VEKAGHVGVDIAGVVEGGAGLLKAGKSLAGVAKSVDEIVEVIKAKNAILDDALKGNYSRFISKIPANSKASSTFQLLDDGNYLFQASSPGKVPGSSALYQKWVNPQGETFKMLKTTYAPDGSIIHIKPK
jgi:hypothetical protein